MMPFRNLNPKIKVLIVEDDDNDAKQVASSMTGQGVIVDTVSSNALAVNRARDQHYDLVVLDVEHAVVDHVNDVKKIKTPFVVVSDGGDVNEAVKMLTMGASDYVPKNADYKTALYLVLLRHVYNKRIKRRLNIISTVLLTVAVIITVIATCWAWDARDAVTQEHHRLQVVSDMVSATGNSIVVLDPQGNICEWSDSLQNLLGWSWDDVKGSSIDFLMTKAAAIRHKSAINMTAGKPGTHALIAIDGWVFNKSGKMVPVHITVSTFKNHIGNYTIALFSDPTKVTHVAQVPEPQPEPPTLPTPVPGTRRLFK